MKYFSLLAISLAAVTLSACEYKKHPMDKPPPSAMVERDSAPKFDELDKEASKAEGGSAEKGSADVKSEPAK
jgi:hypothetical protein